MNKPNYVLYSLFAATIFAVFAFSGYIILSQLNPSSEISAAKDIQIITDETDDTHTNNTIMESGTVIDPPRELQDFTLINHHGEPLSLSDLQGKYVLLTFGYTRCPDVCPANLLEFRRIKRELGEAANNVAFLFISVDGERDTPELLNQYLTRYDSDFIGMTGTEDVLNRIASDYGLEYSYIQTENSRLDYTVVHTASRFLIDPQRRLVRLYSFTTDAAIIIEDLMTLLNQ
ncbi:MAG: hypothetical protein Kow00117_14030 [Phototrophicales bacterium]